MDLNRRGRPPRVDRVTIPYTPPGHLSVSFDKPFAETRRVVCKHVEPYIPGSSPLPYFHIRRPTIWKQCAGCYGSRGAYNSHIVTVCVCVCVWATTSTSYTNTVVCKYCNVAGTHYGRTRADLGRLLRLCLNHTSSNVRVLRAKKNPIETDRSYNNDWQVISEPKHLYT